MKPFFPAILLNVLDLKGITLVAIVAIAIILAGASIFIYLGLPINSGGSATNSIVSASPETGTLAYVITFAYAADQILAGQNQTITIQITQGAYQVADVSGGLYVMSPESNQTYYQNFGYTTDANGEASFTFPIAQNATLGTYDVYATIASLGELIQNTSSSFEVVSPS